VKTRPIRPARLALSILGLTLLLLSLTHPGRVAVKTLLLLPDMFPSSPLRPLTWLTGPPRFEEVAFDYPAGHIDADVYLPAEGGQHGAVILLLGAVGFPRRESSLVRFADGLSRAGSVVVIPESSNLEQGNITAGDVEGLLQVVADLRARPEVDPTRIGFLGFSVGGSVALLTAIDERGRQQIAFVSAFGSYYDAVDLLRDVASHTILLDGQTRPWEPADLTVWVFSKQVIAALPDQHDRDVLGRAFLDKQPEALVELDGLSPDGRLVLELLEGASRARVAAILSALPPSVGAKLTSISPSQQLELLQAHLYLMHDRADSYIPFTESRQLAAAAPPGTLRAYEEFDLFAHVMPDRPLDAPIFVRELLKLYHHAWRMCLEFL
jgi:acetyl esterase/lipase